MKSQLLYLIQVVIELLMDCGWEDNANWLSKYKNAIENTDQNTERFYKLLDELDDVLSGMGSLSDLPLRDKTGERSEQEIRSIQWDLIEQLGEAIETLRKAKHRTAS